MAGGHHHGFMIWFMVSWGVVIVDAVVDVVDVVDVVVVVDVVDMCCYKMYTQIK